MPSNRKTKSAEAAPTNTLAAKVAANSTTLKKRPSSPNVTPCPHCNKPSSQCSESHSARDASTPPPPRQISFREVIEKAVRARKGTGAGDPPVDIEKMNSYKTPWDIMIAAQSGDPDAMYMMGIFCSQRLQFGARPPGVSEGAGQEYGDVTGSKDSAIVGSGLPAAARSAGVTEGDLVSAFGDMTLAHSRAAAESESRAFYWFRRAAEVGHIASMPSLAHRLKKGTGTPIDTRAARDWNARGMDLGCQISHDAFVEDSLLTREAAANAYYFKAAPFSKKAPISPKLPMLNPHLHGLLLAVGGEKMQEEKFQSLFYRKHCLELERLLEEAKGTVSVGPVKLEFVACRAGSIKDHTDAAFTKGPPAQSSDSLTYRIGSFRGFSELVLYNDETYQRRWRNAMPPYLNLCSHISDHKPISSCALCLLDAKHRLLAISFGQYAMSTRETHPGCTYEVVWVNLTNGQAKRETFKGYCRKEVEFVLRELRRFGWGYLHPYHIAMDPNLLWPIVYYYGSVRAAIEVIAPEVGWEAELGPVTMVGRHDMPRPEGEGVFLFGPEHEGQSFTRCAASGCGKLEVDKKFSLCGKCKRRRYCSRECQVGDWSSHKRECAALAVAQ
ncbi:hypothetical protein HDV00_005751 [Rhizophlyctis rosea]|nr:hypothetical protein HDV00_005751 [Rhizophlyctis rosea]